MVFIHVKVAGFLEITHHTEPVSLILDRIFKDDLSHIPVMMNHVLTDHPVATLFIDFYEHMHMKVTGSIPFQIPSIVSDPDRFIFLDPLLADPDFLPSSKIPD